jgi:hypothetical protein
MNENELSDYLDNFNQGGGYALESASVSVSPMGAPKVETEQEQEPEPQAEPQHRMPSAFDDLLDFFQDNIFTLNGNNVAFAIMAILECTFAYAIGKILGAW